MTAVDKSKIGLILMTLAGCYAGEATPSRRPEPGQEMTVGRTDLWPSIEEAEAHERAYREYSGQGDAGRPKPDPLWDAVIASDKSQPLHGGSRVRVVSLEPAKAMMRVQVLEDAGKDERKELARLRAEDNSVAETDGQKLAMARKLTEMRESLVGKLGWVAIPK